MSLFEDVLGYSNPISAGPYALYKEYGQGPTPAPPGTTDPRATYVPYRGANITAEGLANKIFNPAKAAEYGNIFDQGYQNLNQPLRGGQERGDIYEAGTRGLASAFADSVYKKTGKLPSEDQVKSFVAQTLTPGFASKFIQGIPTDQINAIADQYVEGNPDVIASLATPTTIMPQSDPQSRILALNEQLDKIYNKGAESYVNRYNTDVYNPAKTTVANDLAGQGMLTQPNSRYSLDQIESNRGRDIASGLNTLESGRATGALDLGKTIENLLQSQQQISNQNNQFNQTLANQKNQFNRNLNLTQDENDYQRGLSNRQLSIADQLGKLQAGNNKKDWMDYLNTGIGAIGVGAKLAAL